MVNNSHMTKKEEMEHAFPGLGIDEVRQLCFMAYAGSGSGESNAAYRKKYRKTSDSYHSISQKLRMDGYLQSFDAVAPERYLDILDFLAGCYPEWLKAFRQMASPTHSADYLRKLAELVRNDNFEAAARLPIPYEGLGKNLFNVFAYIGKRALKDSRYAVLLNPEQTAKMTTQTLADLERRGTLDLSAIESIRRMIPEHHPLYAAQSEKADLYEFLLTGSHHVPHPPKSVWGYSLVAIRELYAGNVEDALAFFRKAVTRQKPKCGCLPSPVLNYFYAVCIIKYRAKYGTTSIMDVYDKLHMATPVRVGGDNFAVRLLLEYAEINTESASGELQQRASMITQFCTDNLSMSLAMLIVRFFALPDHFVEQMGSFQPALKIMQHELSPYLPLSTKAKEEMENAFGGKPLLAGMHRKAAWELMLSEISCSVETAEAESPRRIIYFMQGASLSTIMEQVQQPDGQWKDSGLLSVKTMCSTGYESMDLLDSRIAMELAKRHNSTETDQTPSDADIVIPMLADTGRVFIGQEYSPERMEAVIVRENPCVEFSAQGDRIYISSNAKIGMDGRPLKHTVIVADDRYTLVSLNPLQRDILGKLLARESLPASAVPSLQKTIESLSGIMEVRENIMSLAQQKAYESDGVLAVRIEPLKSEDGTIYKLTFLARMLPEGRSRQSPGIGEKFVYDEDESGRVHCVNRNMAKEAENFQMLVDFAEQHSLEFTTYNTTSASGERTLLELLALCHDHQDRFITEWPNGQMLKFKGLITGADINIEVRSNNEWFAVEGTAKVGFDFMNLDMLINSCCRESYDGFVRIGENEYVRMTETLRRRIAQLDALLTTGKGKRRGVPKFLVGALAKTIADLGHHTDNGFRQLRDRMKEAYTMDICVPEGLQATLRPYQEEGYRWMARLDAWGAGACLADDMGLGKTLQALTFILSKSAEGPSLVIAPKSVIPNWVSEAGRFAPRLEVAVLNDAADRKDLVEQAGPQTLVLCTYGVLTTEADLLASRQWTVACLDEAQQIKNRSTMVSRAAMNLNAGSRIILTGTPLQNHVGELWNLMQFINPGMLGKWSVFRDSYVNGEIDRRHREMLKEMTQPFILRRTKQQVLTDLPEKIESTCYVEMNDDEWSVYEGMRQLVELKFKKGKTRAEKAKARDLDVNFFEELMKLRLASCDMHLLHDRWKKPSTKVERLMEILQALMQTPVNNIVVFSQFTSFLALIRPLLDKQGWKYCYLDGQTPMNRRKAMVDDFQDGKKRIFLSSLKAGGLGINLTRANYVILLDPWWNPAIERQATDRAHRIGQQRCLSVIRLVSQQTIEEKILRMHEKKQSLSDDILDGTAETFKLSYDDILEMVTPF